MLSDCLAQNKLFRKVALAQKSPKCKAAASRYPTETHKSLLIRIIKLSNKVFHQYLIFFLQIFSQNILTLTIFAESCLRIFFSYLRGTDKTRGVYLLIRARHSDRGRKKFRIPPSAQVVRQIEDSDWLRTIYYTSAFPSLVAIIVKLISQNPKQT